MLGVSFVLTDKTLDAQGNPQDAGPVYFSVRDAGLNSAKELQIELRTGSRSHAGKTHQHATRTHFDPEGSLFAVTATSSQIGNLYNAIVTASGTSSQATLPQTGDFNTVDSEKVAFTVQRLKDLGGNISLFSLELVVTPANPSNTASASKVHYQFTSTDFGGVLESLSNILS